MLRVRVLLLLSCTLGSLAIGGAAQAAANEELTAEQQVNDGDRQAVGDAELRELPGKQYYFLGARYRAQVLPRFVLEAFADGGETVFANIPGIEFGLRQDAVEYIVFAQLGLFDFQGVPFKGKQDAVNAWEIIDSSYKLLSLGVDFMWSSDEFAPGLSLVYGAGVGLTLVLGDLTRTEAYPENPSDLSNLDTWRRCDGPGVPAPAFCDPNGTHYNGFTEPGLTEGGSSPPAVVWLAGQVGLRYKLHRNFVARAELGVGLTGVFLGFAADYGF